MNEKKTFKRKLTNTVPGQREHIRRSMMTLDRLRYLLDKHFEGKQLLLARHLGKSEAEVSKWFNGVQNFTSKTIGKLEAAFGESIWPVATHHDGEHVEITYTECFKTAEQKVVFVQSVIEDKEELLTTFKEPVLTERGTAPLDSIPALS